MLAVIDTEAAGTAPAPAADQPKAAETTAEAALRAGPAARKLLAEQGIDAASVARTRDDGRLTKSDVLAHAATPRPAPAPAPAALSPAQARQPAAVTDGRALERVPMTRLRKRTAERLLQAQQQAALLTTFNEVNMQPLMDLRAPQRRL